MAVVNLKSQPITDRDAVPAVKGLSALQGGILKAVAATIEIATGNTNASTYHMFSLPSNAIVHSLKVYSDDMGANTVTNIGLHRNTVDGNAVVDADFFASALSLKDGALNGVDILRESAVYAPEDIEKPLWEALGLASDPNVIYDVVATLTVTADTGGTLSLAAEYQQ